MIILNKSLILISLTFLALIFLNSVSTIQVKNILVNVFPGGKSHNFVLKELFDYSLTHEKNFKYNYHILVHNRDKDAWPIDGAYTVYGYGDMLLYDLIFNDALELVRKHPIFGYTKFNKAMVHIYEQFFESELLDKFRQIDFDMIISDIPNFLTKFLHSELKIKNNVYCSPPSLPNLFYGMFEMNPSYLPAIGSKFTDKMTFTERFINTVYVLGTKLLFWFFMGEQANTFSRYGYPLKDSDVFIHESFVMIQYPPGLFFNLSLPPNFLALNTISAKPANPISQSSPEIDQFLDKYEKNIYFSQGTIIKIVEFKNIIDLFNHFDKYGFILSFKKGIIPDETLKKFPKNVLMVEWVKQNDLLGDKRLNAFITHGGTNSVSEAIYHFKPIIVLGVTLDQINTAAVVKKRKVGVVTHEIGNINSEVLTKAIEKVLQPEETNEYIKNVRKYGKILRENKEPRKEFIYWIGYGFRLGYDNLLVKAYTEYYYYQLNNYDVFFTWFLIFYLVYYFTKKLLIFLFCSCKPHRKKKNE